MKSSILKRILSYCFGLWLLSMCVALSIKSNLGVSPVNSTPYVLSLITGIDQGLVTTGISFLYIVLQILILRRDFKPINFLQVLFAGVFGYFVTFSKGLLAPVPVPSFYLIRLLFLAASITLAAWGLYFYLGANIVPQPSEGILLAIAKKTPFPFHKIKVVSDVTMVSIATLLSLTFLHELTGVREGTVISAIGIGKLLGVIRNSTNKRNAHKEPAVK